jgi:hypothetical protein
MYRDAVFFNVQKPPMVFFQELWLSTGFEWGNSVEFDDGNVHRRAGV